MNKSEIVEAAKLAEDYLPDLDPQEEFYTICESLIAAARLLETHQSALLAKAVEALEAGLQAIADYPNKEHPMTASEVIFKITLAEITKGD